MFQTLKRAWSVPEIRKKLLYTLLMIVIFRFGSAIAVPFLNTEVVGMWMDNNATGGNFLEYLNTITGGALSEATLFSLSITPYINSSIIIQLLTVAIPYLERLSKEGEEGRKKIATITRYVTLGLGLLQSTAYFIYLNAKDYLLYTGDGFPKVFEGIVVISVLTAGTTLVMWLGEQINGKGIGNGISIILFAGIISRIPTEATMLFGTSEGAQGYFSRGGIYYFLAPFVVVCYLLMIAYIVWMDNAERKIPVQYAKRVVGRKMYGGQSTHIPIKVNMSGVMPVIFASSILSLPPTIELFVSSKIKEGSFWETFFGWFEPTSVVYGVLYFLMIIFFAYFYAAIQYNPTEMANNIRSNSGTIPGIRPGKPTALYIEKIISRIILLGALLLSVVALFPTVFTQITSLVTKDGMNISLGGTSIIIMVGVALETVKQLESQMMLRHYKGFLD